MLDPPQPMNRLGQPLTREQDALRGRDVREFSDAELRLWLDACDHMERWVKSAKARRTWKAGAARANAELSRRAEKARRQTKI
jgi:hypothetical protein